jgi:hypothetical protein
MDWQDMEREFMIINISRYIFSNSKKTATSANNAFTHRAGSAVPRSPEAFREAISGDTPALPNRIAAGPSGSLREWGVVNAGTLAEIVAI